MSLYLGFSCHEYPDLSIGVLNFLAKEAKFWFPVTLSGATMST